MPESDEREPDGKCKSGCPAGLGLLISTWIFLLSISLIPVSMLFNAIDVLYTGSMIPKWIWLLVIGSGASFVLPNSASPNRVEIGPAVVLG
jgi:hypothetical protein